MQSPFSEQTDRRLWDTSLLVFKRLCESGTQRVRRMAHTAGLSKSSVHGLRQAMARRGGSPESWWWETEDGRRKNLCRDSVVEKLTQG